MKRGLRWADQVWLLWHLLGHCYSDMGRFREAEQAYLDALQRPHCNPDWVNLNRSIAFLRAGRIDKAKSTLSSVRSREKLLTHRRGAIWRWPKRDIAAEMCMWRCVGRMRGVPEEKPLGSAN